MALVSQASCLHGCSVPFTRIDRHESEPSELCNKCGLDHLACLRTCSGHHAMSLKTPCISCCNIIAHPSHDVHDVRITVTLSWKMSLAESLRCENDVIASLLREPHSLEAKTHCERVASLAAARAMNSTDSSPDRRLSDHDNERYASPGQEGNSNSQQSMNGSVSSKDSGSVSDE